MTSKNSPFSPEKWPREADEQINLSDIDRLYQGGNKKVAVKKAYTYLENVESSANFKIELASRILKWGVELLQKQSLNSNFERELVYYVEQALKELPLSFLGTIAVEKAQQIIQLRGEQSAKETELENTYNFLLLVEILQLQTGNQELTAIKANLLSMLATQHEQRRETLLAHIYADDPLTISKNFQTYWAEFAKDELETAVKVAADYFKKLLSENKFLESISVIKQVSSLGRPCLIHFASKIIFPPYDSRKYIHTIQLVRHLVGANKHLDELIEVLTNNRFRYLGTTNGQSYDLLKETDPEDDFYF